MRTTSSVWATFPICYAICRDEHTRDAKPPHINGDVVRKEEITVRHKAVTYHEPTVMWLFMIGHSLGRIGEQRCRA